MPAARAMPTIGPRCLELRISDSGERSELRIVVRIDEDAIVIGDVFIKKSRTTPDHVIMNCRRRFKLFDQAKGGPG